MKQSIPTDVNDVDDDNGDDDDDDDEIRLNGSH